MLRSKVADAGYTKMLERFARECPKNQFLREFVKNGIQAIQRHISDTGDKKFKGQIEVDVNWYHNEMSELTKICFTDNGIGMSGEEMIKYVNDLSSSSDIAADHTNYGFGAKVAAAIMNKLGIQYESWKNGQGYMVIFYYDEKEKSYGLHQFNTEGENKFYVPISDEVKPKIIKDHGCRVTLFGNTEKSDTYDCDYHDIKATKESWVLSYLNKRFFNVPENISIKARIGHYRPKEDTRHNFMMNVGGLKKTLDKFTKTKGIVELTDANVEWRILNEDRSGHGREYVTGHTAVIHEDEIFDISQGMGNKAIQFGIYVGYQNISLIVKPKSQNYVQNTTRDRIILQGEDELPWETWQNEFQSKFPKELEKYLIDTMSSISKEDNSKSIKDKLKELRKHFSISKFKKSKNGRYLVNEDDLVENYVGGSEAIKSKGGKNGTKQGQGNSAGLISELVSLQIKEEGIRAEKANPDPYPDVKWISPTDQIIDEKEIIDRAAVFREKENVVFANKEYMGFLDVQKHFTEEFSSLPPENVTKIIRDIFAQQLMETIAGAVTLKNRQHWNPDQYEKAISPESLTVSVGSRYYFFREIKRKLKDPNIRINTNDVNSETQRQQ